MFAHASSVRSLIVFAIAEIFSREQVGPWGRHQARIEGALVEWLLAEKLGRIRT